MPRMTRTRRTAVAVGTLLLATALTACGSNGGSGAAESGGKPQRGGNLTYLDAEIPVSAQVQESGYWQDRALLQNVTDRLLYRNPQTNEIEPWLAKSWKVSADGKRYDFVIRDGVTYSNGQKLDVASVKRNLEWQVNGDSKNAISPNPAFPHKATVTTDPSTSTVTVTLPEPYAPFLGVLTTWSAGLVADKTIDLPREKQLLFKNLIGSGAFVVTTEDYGKKYVLSARKDYQWAPLSWKNQGAAYLDTVTIVPVQEDAVRLGSLKSGQGDLLRYVQPSEEKALAKQGYNVVARSGVGLVNQWSLRQSAGVVTDVKVRQAIQAGIDRKAIVKNLYTENWSAATSLFAPGTVGYSDESSKFAYDPAKSNTLLDAAGWTARDSSGFRTKDGKRLVIKTYVDVFDNTARTLFQAIQSQLKKIGIDLDIHETDYASYDAKTADPSVAAVRTGWPGPDPSILLRNTFGPDGWNVLNLKKGKGDSASLVTLLTAPLSAKTQPEEVAALHKAEDYLLDQAYSIPLLNDSQVYVAGKRVHDFDLNDGGLPEYHNAWVTH
jgi:peptide/nickel transport system substrate-binding protein